VSCGPWAVAAWGPGPRVQRSKEDRAKGAIEQELSAESYGFSFLLKLPFCFSNSPSVLLSNLFQIRVTNYSCIQLFALFYLSC
jgi:hypothetical protein